jgi:hypothetical protein
MLLDQFDASHGCRGHGAGDGPFCLNQLFKASGSCIADRNRASPAGAATSQASWQAALKYLY